MTRSRGDPGAKMTERGIMIRTTKRPGIDVSIVLFFKPKSIPEVLDLKKISLSLPRPIRGFTTGLSGHQRLDGLMFARKYADERKLEMIVIDMLVDFEKPLYPKVMPPEELPKHDVLNLFRVSKSLIEEIASYWREWVIEDEGQGAEHAYDWAKPLDFVARRPDLLPRLLEEEEFQHINLVTHPVLTTFSSRALTATTFRTGYPSIDRVNARFHPDIKIEV